jgi:hypothetical protein
MKEKFRLDWISWIFAAGPERDVEVELYGYMSYHQLSSPIKVYGVQQHGIFVCIIYTRIPAF